MTTQIRRCDAGYELDTNNLLAQLCVPCSKGRYGLGIADAKRSPGNHTCEPQWWPLLLYAIVGCVVVSSLAVLLRRFLKGVSARAAREAAARKRVKKAVLSTQNLDFPFVAMPFREMEGMGRLKPHEDARDHGHLVFIDTIERLHHFAAHSIIVFVSHQWLGFTAPDPDCVHYPVIIEAVRTLCAQEGCDPGEVYVWCDYFSIPQANRRTQKAAIDSIPQYASNATFFLACAPDTYHVDLRQPVNGATYLRRGWCRLECWAYLSTNGLSKMFLYHEDGRLECVMGKRHWYESALDVFHADFTVDSDKHLLVDVVLGLYALARIIHNDSAEQRHNVARERSASRLVSRSISRASSAAKETTRRGVDHASSAAAAARSRASSMREQSRRRLARRAAPAAQANATSGGGGDGGAGGGDWTTSTSAATVDVSRKMEEGSLSLSEASLSTADAAESADVPHDVPSAEPHAHASGSMGESAVARVIGSLERSGQAIAHTLDEQTAGALEAVDGVSARIAAPIAPGVKHAAFALGKMTDAVMERQAALHRSMTQSAVLGNYDDAADDVALALMHEQKEHLFPNEYFGTMMDMLDEELDEVLGALSDGGGDGGDRGGGGGGGGGGGRGVSNSVTKRSLSLFGGRRGSRDTMEHKHEIVEAIQTLRKDALEVQRMKEEATQSEHRAAVKVQALWRGRASRQMANELKRAAHHAERAEELAVEAAAAQAAAHREHSLAQEAEAAELERQATMELREAARHAEAAAHMATNAAGGAHTASETWALEQSMVAKAMEQGHREVLAATASVAASFVAASSDQPGLQAQHSSLAIKAEVLEVER